MRDATLDWQDTAKRAVVRVGDGRGFVVEVSHPYHEYLILTAAHCLPHFPPAHAGGHTEDRTYKFLLGPIGQHPTIWAECLFANPIADIAVLTHPDGQALFNEHKAYSEFLGTAAALRMGDIGDRADAWLLSLDCRWTRCAVEAIPEGGLWIVDAPDGIRGGMSGSPIVTDDGRVIGIIGISSGAADEIQTKGGPQARLSCDLPGWILKALDPPAG